MRKHSIGRLSPAHFHNRGRALSCLDVGRGARGDDDAHRLARGVSEHVAMARPIVRNHVLDAGYGDRQRAGFSFLPRWLPRRHPAPDARPVFGNLHRSPRFAAATLPLFRLPASSLLARGPGRPSSRRLGCPRACRALDREGRRHGRSARADIPDRHTSVELPVRFCIGRGSGRQCHVLRAARERIARVAAIGAVAKLVPAIGFQQLDERVAFVVVAVDRFVDVIDEQPVSGQCPVVQGPLAVFDQEEPFQKRLVLAGCDPATNLLARMVERTTGTEIVTAAAALGLIE